MVRDPGLVMRGIGCTFISTRNTTTPTLFPYTTLFRSARRSPPPAAPLGRGGRRSQGVGRCRAPSPDRKSTRLNSSHMSMSDAVFCLKKKNPRSHSPLSPVRSLTGINPGKSHGQGPWVSHERHRLYFYLDTKHDDTYPLSLHDALPICSAISSPGRSPWARRSTISRRRPLPSAFARSEEHTSELQSHVNVGCRLLLEKKKP